MTEIWIEKAYNWMYRFNTNYLDHDITSTPDMKCEICDLYLNNIYSYIIISLKEANLLPLDCKPICCYCNILQKFGLLDLREHLSSFYYKGEMDVLVIRFKFYDDSMNVRIHDFSKLKWA